MPTSLPAKAKKQWEDVYNSAIAAGDDKETAARKAWGALRRSGWHKSSDGAWVKNADIVPEFSMYFNKVNSSNRRWGMTSSDTLLDRRGESMSLELYKSFLTNIEKGLPVPEPFRELVTDEYWQGGMPYMSVAHYSDLNGEGVPGKIETVYIDGNQLKSKGTFDNTPLGDAVLKALLADKANPNPDNKIRISIAFLDLAHKHGNFVFERKSLDDVCPMCAAGAGNKVYLKGYLVHKALTRKPVNPRSEIEVQASMAKIVTRKEDAASIVGDSLAEELSEKQKALIGLSDVMVERADEPDPDESTEVPTSDEDAEVPAETPTEIEDKSEEWEEVEVVSDSQAAVEKDMGESEVVGPITMKEALDAQEAADEALKVWQLWNIFQNVVYNILDSSGVPNKKEAVSSAMDEFKSSLATKSLVATFSETQPETPQPEPSPLQKSLSALEQAFREQLTVSASEQEKLMAIQPSLDALGSTIQTEIANSVAVPTESNTVLDDVDTKIQKAMSPVMEALSLIQAQLARPTDPITPERRVPQPRSVNPLTVQALTQAKESQLSPIDKIARRSTGLSD